MQGPADLNPGWFVVDPKGAAATWKSTLEDQFKPSLLNEIRTRKRAGKPFRTWKSLLHLDDGVVTGPEWAKENSASMSRRLSFPESEKQKRVQGCTSCGRRKRSGEVPRDGARW